MGIGNVKRVIANWHALPHPAFRALIHMAVRSMDADMTPVYKAGWEELALAIGRPVPDADIDDKTVTRVRRAAQMAVNRAIRMLTERNAIEIQKRPAPGHNTEWALNLDYRTVHTGSEPFDVQRFTPSDPNGSRFDAQRFTPSDPTVHTPRELEEYEELEEQPRKDGGDLYADAAAPRVTEHEEEDPNLVGGVESARPSLRVVTGGRLLMSVQQLPKQRGLWPVAVPSPAIGDAPAVPVRPANARQTAIAAMRQQVADARQAVKQADRRRTRRTG